jgi:hypothetical protein
MKSRNPSKGHSEFPVVGNWVFMMHVDAENGGPVMKTWRVGGLSSFEVGSEQRILIEYL